MRGAEFAELTAFMAVADQRSFAKAAAQLSIAPSTLSQTIRALEERLGVRLLNRTTRNVAPTEAGERLMNELRPALDGVGRAVHSINAFRDKPMGTLRIVMGRAIAITAFAPLIAPFLKAFPDITLDAASDDMRLELVSNRFDAGIRIGETIERDMIAVKLIDGVNLYCVAAPSYLEGREAPRTPRDLADHECIRHRWRYDEPPPAWQLENDGERVEVEPRGRIIITEIQSAVTAAVDGAGIALLPAALIAPHVLEKRLALLLPHWRTSYSGVYIYYPSRRQMPPPLAAFIEFARKATSKPPKTLAAFERFVTEQKRKAPR
jgi:DNA-binding transcriptional LysR family regulator